MKKKRFSLYGSIFLTIVLATTCALAQPTVHNDPCQGSEAQSDACPRVWVQVTPAFFQQSRADHTYVKFLEETGHWQSFPCFGACNGGTDLQGTQSSTWKNDKKIIQYMADAADRKQLRC